MRFLKWGLGLLAALVVIIGIGGMLLPRDVHVSRSIVIDAPPEVIFSNVNSLKAAAEWSPWLGIDPDVTLLYSGPDDGVGATLEWQSDHPDVGSGRQEIVLSQALEKVVTDLDFGDMGTAKAAFLLSETGDGTQVTWTMDADMGAGPIGRWFGLMMDKWVGADYEKGLSKLKTLTEG